MVGILYFSSTGNSLYIAKRIKERFGGKVLYIPTYSGDGGEFERVYIVTPIYSFGLPFHVYELLKGLNNKTQIIVIQNYGGMVGGADRLFYDYSKSLGLNILGVYTLKMPENYTLVMSPPAFYTRSILKSADGRIKKVLDMVEGGKYRVPKYNRTHEKTYLKNKSNWHKMGERFSVTDKCIKCGKCAAICPSNNISLESGKVEFSDKCVACLACFHRCHKGAIIYQGKDNKRRYINPYIHESEIGKNL